MFTTEKMSSQCQNVIRTTKSVRFRDAHLILLSSKEDNVPQAVVNPPKGSRGTKQKSTPQPKKVKIRRRISFSELMIPSEDENYSPEPQKVKPRTPKSLMAKKVNEDTSCHEESSN